MKERLVRSIPVQDRHGNKWRVLGNSKSSVYQKKMGRSWATWAGNHPVPSEVLIAISALGYDDYKAFATRIH